MLRLLFGLVLLRSAMLIAMEAGRSKIAQIVRATVHQRFPMFNGGAGRTPLRKRSLTIAAPAVLEFHQVSTHPHSIQGIS